MANDDGKVTTTASSKSQTSDSGTDASKNFIPGNTR